MQPATFLQIIGHNHLPTLPNILLRLLQACRLDKDDLGALKDIIEKDPALSLKVMRLAYSEKPDQPVRSLSVEQAVQRIGRKGILHLAQWTSAKAVFEPFRECSLQELREFWLHSLRTAYLAELIAHDIHYHAPQNAFLAGLLHDIGKVFLLMNYPVKYRPLFSDPGDGARDLASEKELVGFSHVEIGAEAVRQRLPDKFLADAIYFHHVAPQKIADAFPLVQIVYSANLLAKMEPRNQDHTLQTVNMFFRYDKSLMEEGIGMANLKMQEALLFLNIDATAPMPSQADADGISPLQGRLADEISDYALAGGMTRRLLAAGERTDILRVATQSLTMLLETDPVYIFLYDPHEHTFVCRTGAEDVDQPGGDGLTIREKSNNSLLVASLHKKEMVDSFSLSIDADLSLYDLQLINLCGKEGIVSIPLIFDCHDVGAIVIGINKAEYRFVAQRSKQINLIAEQTASVLYADRTQTQRFEKHLAENLEAAQTRWRKVVHEVNNPLNIINNYLKIFEMRLAARQESVDEIRIIRSEIQRIGQTLKSASPKGSAVAAPARPVDINSLVLDLARLIKGSLARELDAQIHLDLDEALPALLLEDDALKQVVLNLLKNAVEAIPSGGNVRIKTIASGTETLEDTASGESAPPDTTVRIIISDDGPGIPEEIRATLFKPFSTSKEGHEGLGLSIVDTLVKRLKGSIVCESSRSSGTRFTISLPTA